MERSAHPAIQSNSNESLVKEDGRVRVHAAERVEGKRDEAKVMHITDFPTRSDMRLIEAMPALAYEPACLLSERSRLIWQVGTGMHRSKMYDSPLLSVM